MSSTALPGWYVEFQAAILRQAPRPEEIGQDVAEGWTGNQKSLKETLAGSLLPPRQTETFLVLCGQATIEKKVVDSSRPVFTLVVDYGQPLAKMIEAGRYDSVHPAVTAKHFPIAGQGQRETAVEIFHFNRVMSSDQVIAELDRVGYRPAQIEELLAIGAKKPELQRQFPIIALGSRWRDSYGYRHIPCLDGWGGGRELGIYWFERDWYGHCRFLAVRK